jgi:HEAT repeat protein
MSNWKKQFAAVAFTVLALGSVAHAGRGGSAARIRAAVQSTSVDAIIAEVERAEHLVCQDCQDIMTNLLDHSRYEVREVAAWWFAKRPSVNRVFTEQMTNDLAGTDSISVRNAADYLGTVKAKTAIPALLAAMSSGVDADARLHVVRAAGRIGDRAGNPVLVAGMADTDMLVRREAVDRYRDMRGQTDATPLFGLLADSDATVRAHAATSIGGLKGAGARATLETMATSDADASVRRNAVWALGEIGDEASREVLRAAQNDPSGLVRRVATGALDKLR